MQPRGIMAKFLNFRRSLIGIFIIVVIIVIAQLQRPSLGWAFASSPQAYLPVMLKISAPTPTPTPTATPTSTPTATTQPPSDWLDYINWLRSLGGLPQVTENTDWSHGDWLHARYR